MAKKKKGKVIQMLSPENYIKQKSRTLPLFKCTINEDWEDVKIANISIARKHVNGNITVCIYLVDMLCLGVKDSFSYFNMNPTEYGEMMESFSEEMTIIEANYELVHNIIYAASEFAEEYGFKPHKDFTRTTCFMLEEDNDDIKLIEIECGIDNKPAILSGYYDRANEQKAIAQLEKTAGVGNFIILDQDFEDEEFEENYPYEDFTLEDKRSLFQRIINDDEEPDEENTNSLLGLIYSLNNDLADDELIEEYFDHFIDLFDFPLSNTTIPYQMLGLTNDSNYDPKLGEAFINQYEDILGDKPNNFAKFKKENPFLSGTYFLELIDISITNESKYHRKLKKYQKQYPDYSLIQLMYLNYQVQNSKQIDSIPGYPFTIKTIFPNRSSIHIIEMFQYLMFYTWVIQKEGSLEMLIAFGNAVEEILPEDISPEILSILTVFNLAILAEKLK